MKKNVARTGKRAKSPVSLDYNNLMVEAVGKNGLTVKDLQTIEKKLKSAAKNIAGQYQSGGLPFMDLPFQSLRPYRKLAADFRGCDNLVVLGIGGSALGTRAVLNALSPGHNSIPKTKRKGPRLFVADNVDPESFLALLKEIDLKQTVFNVISKSGATAETMSQFLIVYDRLKKALGKRAMKDHLIITTDPQGGVLRKIVDDQGLRSLPVPPGVGGRFSVMTAVGLAPLAMAGVDIKGLLAGAAACQQEQLENLLGNMAYAFAGLNWYMTTSKKRGSLVMMPYADSLAQVADWFGQLWNESLGKGLLLDGREGKTGQTAIKAVGATDQHSQLQMYMEGPEDKTVCFLKAGQFRADVSIPAIFAEHPELAYLGGASLGGLINYEQQGTAMALAKNSRPNFTISMPQISPVAVGYLLHMLEVATVVSGCLYNIDPLDQPGVELGKKYTYGLMGRSGFSKFKSEYKKSLRKSPAHIIG